MSDTIADSDETISMAHFASLGEKDKFLVLSRLMDQCTAHEWLNVQGKVKGYGKDLLSLLPPEVAVRILSYLDVGGLVNGLQICRNWRELITCAQATPVWRNATTNLGLSDSMMSEKLPKYGSLSALVVAAWKHRRCLSSLTSTAVLMSGLNNSDSFTDGCNCHFWAGKGVVVSSNNDPDPRLQEVCEGRLAVLQIWNMTDASSFELWHAGCYTEMFVEEMLPRKWVAATAAYRPEVGGDIVWRGRDPNYWVCVDVDRICYTSVIWGEESISDYDAQAACTECGLMTAVQSTVSRVHGAQFFKFTLLQPLRERAKSSESMVGAICKLIIPESSDLANLEGPVAQHFDKVLLLNVKDSVKDGDFCTAHYLIITFCGNIVVYSIPTCAAASESVYDPVQVLKPEEADELAHLCTSTDTDRRLLAALSKSTHRLHIWEVDTGFSITAPAPTPVDCLHCLALGYLYSIYEREEAVKVAVTFTGEVILTYKFGKDMVRPTIWPPINCEWLSDAGFEHYPSQRHIATMDCIVDQSGVRKHEVKSIIAFQ